MQRKTYSSHMFQKQYVHKISKIKKKKKEEWKDNYQTGQLFLVKVIHGYCPKFLKYTDNDQEDEYLNRWIGKNLVGNSRKKKST